MRGFIIMTREMLILGVTLIGLLILFLLVWQTFQKPPDWAVVK